MTPKAEKWLEKVRRCALALPEVTERLSHGAPSFFVKQTKNFLNFTEALVAPPWPRPPLRSGPGWSGVPPDRRRSENHHGDGRLALWCAATLDAQQLLVNAEPKHFFVPAYVGHLGWVGVRLDTGLSWPKVKALIEQAWRVRAPKSLEHAAPRAGG